MPFDAQKEKDRIANWIREYFQGTDFNAIIGISGGKDSAIVAALLVEALGSDRVIGIMLPQGEQQADMSDALQLAQYWGIRYKVINIGKTVATYISEMTEHDQTLNEQALINIPATIRMAMLYSVAAVERGLVANTCNLSEDWIGYSTKFGDAQGDFSVLADYTVTEVKAIGKVLGLPENIVNKVPADGLCGLSDEERLGFTYDVLDRYIREGICESGEIKEKIDRLHKANLHKLLPMPKCEFDPS